MSEKIMKKGRVLMAALLGTVMVAALTLWGCGTKGYDDVAAERSAAEAAAVTTTKSPAIIDATTLKGWIDEGKLNAAFGSKDRVVVVSYSTLADWTAKGHIPGAVRLDRNKTEVAKDRIEGLALATTMMPDGAMMDGIIQRLGIDSNTTIVVSLPKASGGDVNYQAVAFWNFRYWGFSRDRLKILNGGDDAWEVAGLTLATDAVEKYTASTYSVSKNTALKDVVRYSITEMIGTVDALIATPALKDTWQMIDVRGTTITPYLTNALRSANNVWFMNGKHVNDETTRNYVYPSKETAIALLASTAVTDGANPAAYVSPTKKTVVMCGSSTNAAPSFVLFDAVLNVPEGDIAMYDGSSSQWNVYNTKRLIVAYPSNVATAVQINAWTFNQYTSLANPNAATKNRAQGSFASYVNSTVNFFSAILAPTNPDMNQIENIDKAYIKPAATTGTAPGTSTGGGTPGGC
jgi:3-mercaptopyruvate sulfurtransferase SseA